MSEKLTVAELLARNGRESSSADTGRRRRRHRNLEKGGVSVAELTGSIPVVQTEDDAAKDTAAAKPEEQGKKPQQDQRSVSPTPERPEEKTGQLSVAKDAEGAKRDADIKGAADVRGTESEKPTFGEVARGQVAEKAEPTKSEPEQVAKPTPQAVGKTSEKAPEKKTTGATKEVKPIKPSRTDKAEKPGEAEKSGKTGVAAAAVAGGAGAAGAAGAAKSAEADAAEKVGAKTEAKQRKAGAEAKAEKAREKTQRPKAGAKSESQISRDEHAQFTQLEESLEDGEVVEYEDDTISWPMMLLQAVLAIAVGVGVFFGFSLVWAKAPALLALVLAIAVTLLLVGLVHALLRHRDKLLMILAAVVGLVLTIGPRLVQGL